MRFYYFRPFHQLSFSITTALSHNETKFNHHGIYSHRLILYLGSLLKLHLTAGRSGLARQAYRQTLILSPKSDSPLELFIILHRGFNGLQLPRRITWFLLSSVCTLPSSYNSDTPVYIIATRKYSYSERISSIGSAKMGSHGIIGHCYPRILSTLAF